ncbi:hypothetical protein K438DRAFT_1968495 [Mycena galopus ATCC 62051]|nr:hypothetical protein K438DRAFT_1968495 [Mycena galopus ATCC 62051]
MTIFGNAPVSPASLSRAAPSTIRTTTRMRNARGAVLHRRRHVLLPAHYHHRCFAPPPPWSTIDAGAPPHAPCAVPPAYAALDTARVSTTKTLSSRTRNVPPRRNYLQVCRAAPTTAFLARPAPAVAEDIYSTTTLRAIVHATPDPLRAARHVLRDWDVTSCAPPMPSHADTLARHHTSAHPSPDPYRQPHSKRVVLAFIVPDAALVASPCRATVLISVPPDTRAPTLFNTTRNTSRVRSTRHGRSSSPLPRSSPSHTLPCSLPVGLGFHSAFKLQFETTAAMLDTIRAVSPYTRSNAFDLTIAACPACRTTPSPTRITSADPAFDLPSYKHTYLAHSLMLKGSKENGSRRWSYLFTVRPTLLRRAAASLALLTNNLVFGLRICIPSRVRLGSWPALSDRGIIVHSDTQRRPEWNGLIPIRADPSPLLHCSISPALAHPFRGLITPSERLLQHAPRPSALPAARAGLLQLYDSQRDVLSHYEATTHPLRVPRAYDLILKARPPRTPATPMVVPPFLRHLRYLLIRYQHLLSSPLDVPSTCGSGSPPRMPRSSCHPQRRPNHLLKSCPWYEPRTRRARRAMQITPCAAATVFTDAPPSAQSRVLSRSAGMARTTPSVHTPHPPPPRHFRPVPTCTLTIRRADPPSPLDSPACTYFSSPQQHLRAQRAPRIFPTVRAALHPSHLTTVPIFSAVPPLAATHAFGMQHEDSRTRLRRCVRCARGERTSAWRRRAAAARAAGTLYARIKSQCAPSPSARRLQLPLGNADPPQARAGERGGYLLRH